MPRRSRLARLLLLVEVLQFGAAAAWAAWRIQHSPVQAAAGALLILLIGPVVLAIELALLVVVGHDDPTVPRPPLRQLVAAWLAESCFLYQVFYWRQPFFWRAEGDFLPPEGAGRQGVVLVHGFCCNRGFWAPWMRQLRMRGHPCVAVNLEPVFGSIDGYVDAIDAAVRSVAECTQRPPILVAHSMGGLAVRAWLRKREDGVPVRQVITIASPHHGTWLARFSSRANGRQMRLASEWLRQLQHDEQRRPRPPWACWYGNCDNVVFPVTTARLPGADNRLLAGLPHVALAFHPAVMAATLDLVSASGPSLSR